MDEHSIKLYRRVSLGFLAIIISLAFFMYLVVYIHKDVTSKNQLIFWTVKNHLEITIGLILLSGLLGYLSSALTFRQVTKTKKESKRLLDMLFLFLSTDERDIIDYLVRNGGAAGQADIARLPNMGRVKAFRSLQKMQTRNLLDITAHGKIRKISLKADIFNLLTQ